MFRAKIECEQAMAPELWWVKSYKSRVQTDGLVNTVVINMASRAKCERNERLWYKLVKQV